MDEPSQGRVPAASVIGRRLPSVIWLVPALAAAVGLWLVVHAWLQQGTEIKIRFTSAGGVEAGKTKIRYKEVDIGMVQAIAISDDRKGVLISAQLSKQASDLLEADSKFFIVRPRIAGGTVSGLSTLFSGPYIAIEPGAAHEMSESFVGLETPPVVTNDVPGHEFVLHGEDKGSLDFGSPIYYRRVEVGHVTRLALEPNGQGVEVGIFVNAPYDRFVTANSRFWHASGVDLSLDANGLNVSTQSLVSIVEGGIAFQDLSDVSPALNPAPAGSSFTLYSSRAQALQPPDSHRERYVMYFPESLRGLQIGAPVDFRGIVIGEVKSLGVEYEQGGSLLRFPVAIDVYPDRLRSHSANARFPEVSEAQSRSILSQLIVHGLRGQLRSGNLLTGQLYIAMDFFPDAPKASVDWAKAPPVVPTRPSGLTEIHDALGRIARKIDRLPLEQLSAQLSEALASLDQTLKETRKLVNHVDADVAPQATRTLTAAEHTLKAAESVLAEDAPLQQDLQRALRAAAESARSLATLADYLERHPESLIRGKAEDPR